MNDEQMQKYIRRYHLVLALSKLEISSAKIWQQILHRRMVLPKRGGTTFDFSESGLIIGFKITMDRNGRPV